MDWNEWLADATRDVVLLLLGAVIAWLSGLSAAKRAEKSEDKKRLATDAAAKEARELAEADARKTNTARESRDALKVIYELDQSLEGRGSFDAKFPDDLLTRLRAVGDLIPDEVVRRSVTNMCSLANSFELLVNFAPPGSSAAKPSSEMTFHTGILANTRSVLAAAARGDSAPEREAAELAEFAATQDVALDAYWANQAEVYEQMIADNGVSTAGAQRAAASRSKTPPADAVPEPLKPPTQ
jgi:hypothetical protein